LGAPGFFLGFSSVFEVRPTVAEVVVWIDDRVESIKR
jgi:hypothetical protein